MTQPNPPENEPELSGRVLRETLVLAEKAQAGNDDAWSALDARIRPWLVRQLSRHRLPSGHDPDDVIQEVLLYVHRKFDQFVVDPKAGFRSWLKKILRHKVIDLRRREQAVRRNAPAVSLDAEGGDPVDRRAARPSVYARAGELREHLDAAKASLSPKQAEVIRLRDEDGLSSEDIAERMGLAKPGTARVALSRARGAVQDKLKEFDDERERSA